MSKKTNTQQISNKGKKRKNQKDVSNKILLIIFLALCIIVFILATIMIATNASSKKDKYDIRVPITEKELSEGINIKINMDDVLKNRTKEYRIQVTNYIQNTVNDKVLKYQIELSPSSKKDKVDIELYSSKDNFELLNGKTKLTGISLKKDKKETITYTLKLTQRQNPTEKQYVNVEIAKD